MADPGIVLDRLFPCYIRLRHKNTSRSGCRLFFHSFNPTNDGRVTSQGRPCTAWMSQMTGATSWPIIECRSPPF